MSARPASATIPQAPECPRMKAISSGPSMKLTGTRTTPSRAVAKASSTYCQQLWLSSASRSPLARPRAASACAARLTAASNSAYVTRKSPATTASLPGYRAALRCSRSPTECCRARVTIELVRGLNITSMSDLAFPRAADRARHAWARGP